jgi:hypothetical protein
MQQTRPNIVAIDGGARRRSSVDERPASPEVTNMEMTWIETLRLLGLDLLALLLLALVAGDCVEYVVGRMTPRRERPLAD